MKRSFVGFRLTPDLRSELEAIAEQEARSISQVCELLLRSALEDYRKQGPPYLQRAIPRTKPRAVRKRRTSAE